MFVLTFNKFILKETTMKGQITILTYIFVNLAENDYKLEIVIYLSFNKTLLGF